MRGTMRLRDSSKWLTFAWCSACFLKGKYTQKWKFYHRLVFPHDEVCKKNPTSILPSCSPWQRPTSRPIFDSAMTCDADSPETENASFGPVFRHRHEDKEALLPSLPEKVWVGRMATNDSSGERRTESVPCRFEQEFDDREAVRPRRRWRRRWSPGSLERPGSSSQPKQRLSKTSYEWDIVVGVSVIARKKVHAVQKTKKNTAAAAKKPPAWVRVDARCVEAFVLGQDWSRCGIYKLFWEPQRPG